LQTVINTGESWFESPVAHFNGNLDEIRCCIPEFERRPFAAAQPDGMKTCLNERFDMIVRKPYHDDTDFVPINVVSKNYALVPHQVVLAAAVQALKDAGIPTDGIMTDLDITRYGERMRVSLYLPSEYDFAPDDGHKMKIRLECLNSVDGNSRFRALMSWFRQVCSNGLTVGIEKNLLRRRHAGDMDLGAVHSVLTAGLEDALNDQKLFYKWSRVKVSNEKIVGWIEKSVQDTWGFKAAARAYHISQTGHDADLIPVFEKQRPIEAKENRGQPLVFCYPQANSISKCTL
jgi:hypothetical protein